MNRKQLIVWKTKEPALSRNFAEGPLGDLESHIYRSFFFLHCIINDTKQPKCPPH
jgi:hypothetical protein